jgi:hypothetical protein
VFAEDPVRGDRKFNKVLTTIVAAVAAEVGTAKLIATDGKPRGLYSLTDAPLNDQYGARGRGYGRLAFSRSTQHDELQTDQRSGGRP